MCIVQGAASNGRLSKEDAARICVEALDSIPPKGLIIEFGFDLQAVPPFIDESWSLDFGISHNGSYQNPNYISDEEEEQAVARCA
ncbi:hypothetical protein AXF42_Ash006822 [Apostasia shenzhenica]|uniref:Uncharacterized protein n=1 Tax=Apostasia shenzhenica TaxID=1088818 RepID=A0A2I0AJA4_9ASPA|nr:hypothetical protein AXF42_Ash006822 [Apostasia shenzhenica]